MVRPRVEVWSGLRLDTRYAHTRAFINFLRRRGDKVEIVRQDGASIDIKVTYCDEQEPADETHAR